MSKMEVTTSPRILQNIALTAVVVFGLVISYAIHITSQVVVSATETQQMNMQNSLSSEAQQRFSQ